MARYVRDEVGPSYQRGGKVEPVDPDVVSLTQLGFRELLILMANGITGSQHLRDVLLTLYGDLKSIGSSVFVISPSLQMDLYL